MSFVVTWIVLAALWFGLSGFTDAVHLTFGAIAVTIVSALSHRHLTGSATLRSGFLATVRTIAYIPWLFWQIVLANVDVALRVLGVRPIEPRMVRYVPELDSEYGRTLLANSITLTPGTVTVEVYEDGAFLVHALTPAAAEGVLSRDMERRVRHIERSALGPEARG